ncbi:flagellar export chaperone FliS [Clostridium sardiniense]|uniref:Flagellar secretion chaperone FliS n=1 Tax=Clostridium sardiniense TaxID=29369 RepID=A0ABS7KV33_CLOSR|nr:flagellar export chaperone FliS [Clostridium sardiniense]MBM7835427.1 flagellar protein FliS [Clostridium sardiniense]MBY0754671.1 flagellar export chaperone FliS [Clostridium sardiniense]MDQ0460609.1 flagellar protein FliS [Clostridium sardiniense]
MYNSSNNPYNAYKNNTVNMASKEQLLLMLVDGAVKYTKIARLAIEKKDIQKAHEELVRVQNIFTELMSTLDRSLGEDFESLFKLYGFIKDRLVQANIKKDIQIIDEVLPLIESVRDTWYEVIKKAKGL